MSNYCYHQNCEQHRIALSSFCIDHQDHEDVMSRFDEARSVTVASPAPKATGIKHDQEKLRMELISTEAMRQLASVLTFGAKKYASHNWRGGIEWSRVIGAALRHLTSFNDGEDKDPESGLSHLAHAMCCLMFLLEYEKTHKELDNRYVRSKK